jgi:hypothetical protein
MYRGRSGEVSVPVVLRTTDVGSSLTTVATVRGIRSLPFVLCSHAMPLLVSLNA